jgi:hypothetical protein
MHLYITPISAVYIVSGLIGFAISLIALPRYWFTYRSGLKIAAELDRNLARLVNLGVVVTETLRFSVHICTAAVGVQSLFVPPAPPATMDGLHRIFGLEIVVVLLWANFATTINSAIVYAQHRLLRSRGRDDHRERVARSAIARLTWQLRKVRRTQRTIEGRVRVADAAVADHEERLETVEEVIQVAQAAEDEKSERAMRDTEG